jgi:hypothetical protein
MIVDKQSKKVFKPENWKEYFRIDFSDIIWKFMTEGSPIPRWYIPVRRSPEKLTIECWLLPLAPFAWLYYLLGNIFHVIWFDAFKWNEMIDEWRKAKYISMKKENK